ncbi:DUF6933 domain-containing protein [Levilactobacillus acidifarinae]|uniref:DUF6933 domain-containing protein n=1 Tax=Levilactobacillus acidifarinae DSM 19394 = JCM 15949 TaxID=1423715 RepID=A0A0R1LRY3_9LACO|nr:hypothetical protein [Levilactobacillus acidifarinae]KRK95633.1 hypothetical protein FD25_GL000048 [Levilactobacillus acidifarinae DSM 19394]GEO69368.1 hypothetical protein LAC03_12780 [Levilactobacillus acidifarinae]
MFLNVTQKSRDLFRDYPVVRSIAAAQREARVNPMFSWHATAITGHGQRFVVISHDASALCVVLNAADLTASQRLSNLFWSQLAAQWAQYGLTAADLATYRDVAGDWQLNQPLDHQRVRRLNEQGMYVDFLWQQDITSTLEMSLLVAQTPPLGRQQPLHQVATITTDLASARFHWQP